LSDFLRGSHWEKLKNWQHTIRNGAYSSKAKKNTKNSLASARTKKGFKLWAVLPMGALDEAL
jgi:hypothetical protein